MNKPKRELKACIISCIDYRIQETFYKWLLKHHLLGKADIIEVAGSSRDLSKPLKPEDRDELLRNISISVKLHNPKSILLFDHQDCGGYAQDKTIQKGLPQSTDMEHHFEYIKIAQNILENLYPDLQIKAFYITLDHVILPF